MNMLVCLITNEIKHINHNYDLQVDKVSVSKDGEFKFDFLCHSINDSIIVETDEVIDDFQGNKYLYEDDQIILNPEFIEGE